MCPTQRKGDDIDRLQPLVQDRVYGALLGAALGDGLGAPFQQQRQVDLDKVQEWAKSTQPLNPSRDVARCLDVAQRLAGFEMVDNNLPLAVRPDTDPAGSSWFRAEHAVPFGLAGLGLDTGPATALAATSAAASAARSAAADHDADQRLQDAAALQAAAVTTAATSVPGVPFSPAWQCRQLSIAVDALHLRRPINLAAELAATHATPWRAAQLLGTSGPDAPDLDVNAPAALTAWLRHPDDPVAVVLYAVALGGPVTGIPSMAGAIAGARGGPQAWPATWLARLPNLPTLTDAADELTTAICGWLRRPVDGAC